MPHFLIICKFPSPIKVLPLTSFTFTVNIITGGRKPLRVSVTPLCSSWVSVSSAALKERIMKRMPEEKLSGKTPVLHLWTRHSPPTTNFLSLSSLLISTLPFNTFPAALGGSAGQRHSLESLQSETWMLPSITALLIKPQAADLLK